ncbi:MAG TPA: hypothetical protein VM511_13840 [Luteolibacter sp.]|nr:hypothetical protein [Luteolibacter sp.]
MLNYPYAPPSGFDVEPQPLARLWPGWMLLVPFVFSLFQTEVPHVFGWVKMLFPVLLFLALTLKGNPFRTQFAIVLARLFSIALAASFLFRKSLGFVDVQHVIWVVCFLAGSFLSCHPMEDEMRRV